MKIGIVGNGVVGSATAKAWNGHCDEVRVYDVLLERWEHSLKEVLACDFVFVCLPTPQLESGKGIDVSALISFFGGLNSSRYKNRNFVIKSTVPIGYTRRVSALFPNVVHSPEFLTERTAEYDAANPRLNVVGIPKSILKDVDQHPVVRLYRERFPVRYTVLFSDESEAMKLVMNSWFAVKIAFWNEIQAMCVAQKLSYSILKNSIVDEGRVHELHTAVPGPDGNLGFGGKCLPVNLSELIRTMDALGLQHGVCRAAYDRNELLDRPRTV